MGLKWKIKRLFIPHYVIIGHYTGTAIGCCYGKDGKQDVLNEEPDSTFKRVSPWKCPICHSVEKKKRYKV